VAWERLWGLERAAAVATLQPIQIRRGKMPGLLDSRLDI